MPRTVAVARRLRSGGRIPAGRIAAVARRGTMLLPNYLAGLAGWYDASDSTTLFQDSALTLPALADSEPVGGWKDKSGNNNHALQAIGPSRPALKLAIQSGRPVVRFDGVDDTLFTAAGANGQPATVVAVMRNFIADDNGEHWILSDGALKNIIELDWVLTNAFSMEVNLIAGPAGDTAWHAMIGIFNGTNSSLTFDGTTTAGTVAAGAANGIIRIGSRAGTGRFWNGDIAEALWVNRVLGAGEVIQLAAYLKNKWGTP